MGQIKNIKLHIVTDIKKLAMSESETTQHGKANTESFNMFDFDFGPSAKNNAFLANLMKNVQLQEKFASEEEEEEEEDSDIEEVSEFEDEEEEEEEEDQNTSDLHSNSSSLTSVKPKENAENCSASKNDSAKSCSASKNDSVEEKKDAVT